MFDRIARNDSGAAHALEVNVCRGPDAPSLACNAAWMHLAEAPPMFVRSHALRAHALAHVRACACRDERMQRLVSPDKEPIRPFISRARPLWEDAHISTLMVVGGAGDFFDVADAVIMMDSYAASDVTEQSRTFVPTPVLYSRAYSRAAGRAPVKCSPLRFPRVNVDMQHQMYAAQQLGAHGWRRVNSFLAWAFVT
eukprot:3537004-Pleurochrysis_carterae.AAC.1